MKINCLIIDDEPFARQGMEEYVNDISFLNLVAKCENAMQAHEMMTQSDIHLIFLDIQMPRLTGLDFLKSLRNPPLVIFTTAYPQYALESFALDVIDYLLKPIPFDRFLKAVNKAKELFDLRQISQNDGKASMPNLVSQSTDATREGVLPLDYFFVKTESKYEKIFFDDILYVEALQNYITIHCKKEKITTYLTLKNMEDYLPTAHFIKVQKSFIVALSKIESIDGAMIKIGNHAIPISRQMKDDVLDAILKGKLLIRTK
jgi:DNA-binding LytR/AlgR family response regulator